MGPWVEARMGVPTNYVLSTCVGPPPLTQNWDQKGVQKWAKCVIFLTIPLGHLEGSNRLLSRLGTYLGRCDNPYVLKNPYNLVDLFHLWGVLIEARASTLAQVTQQAACRQGRKRVCRGSS